MRNLLALTISLYSVVATAADFPDPTRPPSWIAGADFGGAPGSGMPGQGQTRNRQTGLQSTIISGARRAAIIDGKTVELGEKHGNAQLIEVNEGSVVLRTAQTRRVLSLFPDVKMTQKEIKTRKTSPESGARPVETSAMPDAQKEKK